MTPKFDLAEYREFLNSEPVEPPPELSRKIETEIVRRLNPSLSVVAAKDFFYHVMGSLITLGLCQQFGFGFSGPLAYVAESLMRLNPMLCFGFCGALWAGGAVLFSKYFLTFDEQRVLGATRFALSFSFVAMTLLIFASLDKVSIGMWSLAWSVTALAVLTYSDVRTFCRFRKFSFSK